MFSCEVCNKKLEDFDPNYVNYHDGSPLWYHHEEWRLGPIDEKHCFWKDYISKKCWIKVFCGSNCATKWHEAHPEFYER